MIRYIIRSFIEILLYSAIKFLWGYLLMIPWIQDIEMPALEWIVGLVFMSCPEIFSHQPAADQGTALYYGSHRVPTIVTKCLGYNVLFVIALIARIVLSWLYFEFRSITRDDLIKAGFTIVGIFASIKFQFDVISRLFIWLHATVPRKPFYGTDTFAALYFSIYIIELIVCIFLDFIIDNAITKILIIAAFLHTGVPWYLLVFDNQDNDEVY